MAPTLHKDDAVRIVAADVADLRIGDIVLVEAGTLYRVHRLVWRRRSWRTRGDALRGIDPPLDPAVILGRAIAVRRGGVWRALPQFPRTMVPMSASIARVYGGGALRLLVKAVRRKSDVAGGNSRKGLFLW
jgi:hypothetical protein